MACSSKGKLFSTLILIILDMSFCACTDDGGSCPLPRLQSGGVSQKLVKNQRGCVQHCLRAIAKGFELANEAGQSDSPLCGASPRKSIGVQKVQQ